MDGTFHKARGEYDERRDSLIAARYKEVAQANIVRKKWEQFYEIEFETAAAQAIRWFEHAMKLKPDRASKFQIKQDLGTLYERFPHLRR